MLLQVRSMTDATRLKGILSQSGVRGKIIQTPGRVRNGGCNFSIQIQSSDLSKAEKIAKNVNIPILSVFGSDSR